MKSLLLTLEYPPFKGGVANYYGHLVRHWPDRDGVQVINHQEHWFLAVKSLLKVIKKDKDTFVLIGQVLPLGTVAYLVYLIKKYNYAVFLHGMDFTFAMKQPRKKWLMFLSLSRSKKIICANSYVASLVRDWKPELASKIIVVNPGIDESSINRLDNNAPLLQDKYHTKDKVTLLSLGRLVKRKGVDMVIKAIASLDQVIQDKISYIVVGAGEAESYLKNLATSLNVKVTFTGEVSELEKWSFLNLCDIFVMPARSIDGDFEGFGIVYLEANIYGKPVIAGRSGGVSDAVSHNESGLLINPESTEEIASAIKFLVENSQERLRLGKLGRERALHEFLWSNQIKNLYNNL